MTKFRVLDLFSGLGGFSKAFVERGHTVHTLDNGRDVNSSDCTYNMNVFEFSCKENQYDIIIAGVPCTEYARWGFRGCNPYLRDTPPPDNKLLIQTLKIIQQCKPKYWVIENVRSSVKFINEIAGKFKKRIGQRWFWGNFPEFESDHGWYLPKFKKGKTRRNRQTAQLSCIEYPISLAFCKAMENGNITVKDN